VTATQIRFLTLVRREVSRFMKIKRQTVGAPLLETFLYISVFGAALGSRIKNIHFKEFTKKGTDYSLESFRLLLDGTTSGPAVMEALGRVGYEGYLTFEYFHPFPHYPEALIVQTSDALDRILGRKA